MIARTKLREVHPASLPYYECPVQELREGTRVAAARVSSTIEKYGGRYLARGGQVEVIEGDWQPGYVAIVEFATLDQAKGWYEFDEYHQIKPLRLDNANSQIMFIDGLPSS